MLDSLKKIDISGIGLFLLIVAVTSFLYSTYYSLAGKIAYFCSLFFLFFAMFCKMQSMRKNRMLVWYGVFFCWACFTSRYSSHPNDSLEIMELVAVTQIPIIFSVGLYCTSQDRIKKLMVIYLLAAMVLCFFVLWDGPGVGMRYGWHVAGEQPNTPALNLAAAFAFSIFLFFNESNRKIKIFYLLTALLVSVVIFLTGSRKIIIYMAGVICGLFLYRSKNIKKTISALFLIIILLLIGYFLLTQNQFLYEAMGQRIFTDLSDESSAVERTLLREKGLEFFFKSPIWGNGVDSFKWVCFAGVYSHNNYIEIANGMGLIGLFIYYSYLIFIAVKLWNGRNNRYNFLFFLILIMTFAIEYYNVNYLQRGIFVVYTLAYCQYRIGCCDKNHSEGELQC